jgi:hypothetical protein
VTNSIQPMPIVPAILAALMLGVAISSHAQPKPIAFQSSATQASLLELFTSEGCSSCPPAERWLTGLKEAQGLWKKFVPVAFHVDYWDYLGWRDPWASKAYSVRQRAYAASWGRPTVYTPGFVLDGKEWRERPLPKNGPPSSSVAAGVLKVTSADRKHWQVSFAVSAADGTRYEAHAALLENDVTSDVNAGENKGRQLKHDFVVITLTSGWMTSENRIARGQFLLDGMAKAKAAKLSVAVWITPPGHQEPLQATGGWLW